MALALTTFAGMATGIGSVIAFVARRTNYRFLSVSTGFSAGVMLYVSFVEIFFKGSGVLVACYGEPAGRWINVASFFGGVAGIMVYISLDQLLPTSRAYGKGHDSLLGLISGMAVMALSLLLMKG